MLEDGDGEFGSDDDEDGDGQDSSMAMVNGDDGAFPVVYLFASYQLENVSYKSLLQSQEIKKEETRKKEEQKQEEEEVRCGCSSADFTSSRAPLPALS